MTRKEHQKPVYKWAFFDQFVKETSWEYAKKALDDRCFEALKAGENVYSQSERLYFTVSPLHVPVEA